jgi:hypothetical protein
MAQRYRKIDPRIWNDEKFRALSREEKLIALYVLTAQSNRLGFFKFSKALAAEDLNMPVETFSKGFDKVCKALAWRFDEEARVLLIPKWFRYNCPDNPNTLKSCLEDLHELPRTPLVSEFALCVQYLPQALHETFRKGLEERYGERYLERLGERYGERYPQRMPHQEQEQEQEQEKEQEQEQEVEVSSARSQAIDAKPPPEQAGSSPPFLVFPTRGKEDSFSITDQDVAEYERLYPGLDVRCELRKALAWIRASPDRMKTAKGMPRFIVNWLNRAVDSARGTTRGPTATANGALSDLERRNLEATRLWLAQKEQQHAN